MRDWLVRFADLDPGFYEEVRRRAPEYQIPESYVDALRSDFLEPTGLDPASEALSFIRGRYVNATTAPRNVEKRVLASPITAGARITSAERLDQIRPAVEAFRAAFFHGETTPPFEPSGSEARAKFEAVARAATWITEEGSKSPPGPHPVEALERAEREAQIPARQARAEYEVRLPRRRLRFLRPARSTETTVGRIGERGLTVGWVDVPGPPMDATEAEILLTREVHPEGVPPLWLLERRCHCWAEETGFRPWDLVTFVLTGLPPVLPPARVTVQTWPTLEFHLQVLAGDVTEQTLFDLLRRARREHRVRRRKPLQARHEKLRAAVARYGGPPTPRLQINFWRTICRHLCGTGARSRDHVRTHANTFYDKIQARTRPQGRG
jgi:hypothetical protein